MMRINTISIRYIFRPCKTGSLSGRTGRNQLGKIYARISLSYGNPVELCSDIQCEKGQWNSRTKRLRTRDEISQAKNYQLESWESGIRNAFVRHSEKVPQLTAKHLKLMITGRIDNHDLITRFKTLMEGEAYRRSKSTNKQYHITSSYLVEFILDKFRQDSYPMELVNYEFIDSFDRWLKINKKCQAVGASKHHKRLNFALRHFCKCDLVPKNPYEKFEIPQFDYEPQHLNPDELKRMEEVDLSDNKRLDQVRDAFLLGCYTGLSYGDIKITRRKEIIWKKNHQYITKERQKSKVEFSVRLVKPALALLDKYSIDDTVKVKDCLIPIASNQKVNEYLKELQILCSIEKRLHFHRSRHTFATTIVLDNGGSYEGLKRMMGHKRIQTTQQYGAVNDKVMDQDMDRIDKSLEK